MQKKEYFYGLDQLRSGLMLMGVLIHTVALINPFYQWNYVSQYRNEFIHNLVYVTHFFRMEAFFVIAGFFSAMVLAKKGTRYFISGRYKRVLIPLLSSILFINTFEVWFIVENGIKTWQQIGLPDFIVHSWFLLTLMILSWLCLLPADKILDWLGRLKLPLQLCLAVIYMLSPYGLKFLFRLVIPEQDFPLFYTLFDYFVERTLYYSLYFFLGYQIYRSEYLKSLLKNKKIFTAVSMTALAGLLYQYAMIGAPSENQPSIFLQAANLILKHITALSTSWILFAFFSTAHFRPSDTSAFFVRSAIIIYLFHHPLVIVIGYYMDIPGLTSTGYFLIVSVCVYLWSFFIYFLIDSNRYTRWLFGIR
ncbi:acyltransferase family protein [Neisseria sp. CCUG12390]|uniref:acyltransferase family protein n=1 Tax=Neisseria sp. CCUG12390 TaxID=3392035 RepID=UPI003A1035BE